MPGIQEHEKLVLSWSKEREKKDNYWHECIREISLAMFYVLNYVRAAYSLSEMVNSENKWKQCLYMSYMERSKLNQSDFTLTPKQTCLHSKSQW